jgi:hypothetical protein
MTTKAILRIEFTSYWISGTGAAQGRNLDVVTHRDRNGWPAMPMSQVKGQLRETAERLAKGRHFDWTQDLVILLFGSRLTPDNDRVPDGRSIPGALAFRGEARLLKTDGKLVGGEKNKLDVQKLFHRVASTKINDYGVAEDQTLRAVEAAEPLVLQGEVELIRAVDAWLDWVGLLDAACAATLAFGKLKADGYGRALASMERVS